MEACMKQSEAHEHLVWLVDKTSAYCARIKNLCSYSHSLPPPSSQQVSLLKSGLVQEKFKEDS